jgi:chitodextrinase
VVTNPGAQGGTVGTALSLTIAATDADGDPLSFTATGLPAGLTLAAASGVISGTPTTAGASTVVVSASDGRGGTGSTTFGWTIQPPPDTTPPSSPGGLAVTGTTTTSITLAWSASTDTGGSGLAGYRIYRDGASTPHANVTGTTFSDSGLTSGSTHTYRVSAHDVAGNESAAAGPVTGTARDIQAPTTPTGLQASNVTATSARLTWQASTDTGGSGLASYRVFRDAALIATVSGTSFTDATLAKGTRYRFTVAAVDGAGNQSEMSGHTQVNTKRK